MGPYAQPLAAGNSQPTTQSTNGSGVIQPFTLRTGETRREGPVFFKFEKPGDQLQGLLRAVSMVQMSGKPVPQYVMEVAGRGMVKFNGTADIQIKLDVGDVGSYVRMRYLRDENIGQQSPMRVFDVVVTPPAQPNAHGVEISDADLPENMR